MDYRWAERVAEKYLEDNNLLHLPVDPIAIAEKHGIIVEAKPASDVGVSGMLIKYGNQFGIAYATHIDVEGFQRFSIAHELGHYFLPGHHESILPGDGVHQSRAGFISADKYETEADHFAAGLLMPQCLFIREIDSRKAGYEAISEISELCRTSLTATAIRYTKFTADPVAVVLSEGKKINWCFISEELKQLGKFDWPKNGQPIPRGSTTHEFNKNRENIENCETLAGGSISTCWLEGTREFEMSEEVVGLGKYRKTLTVLTVAEDIEDIEEQEELLESWTPRFSD